MHTWPQLLFALFLLHDPEGIACMFSNSVPEDKYSSWTVWQHSSLCIMFIVVIGVIHLFWNKGPTDYIAKNLIKYVKITKHLLISKTFKWPHRLWDLIRKEIASWKSHDFPDSFIIPPFKAQKCNTGFEISLVYSHISNRPDTSQSVLEFSCTPGLLLACGL